MDIKELFNQVCRQFAFSDEKIQGNIDAILPIVDELIKEAMSSVINARLQGPSARVEPTENKVWGERIAKAIGESDVKRLEYLVLYLRREGEALGRAVRLEGPAAWSNPNTSYLVKLGQDAAQWRRLDTLRFLMENGLSLNAKRGGCTLLHIAAAHGEMESARFLIENGVKLNEKDKTYSGATPLHFATMNKKRDMVELLLESGANPNAAISGRSALEFAQEMGDEVIISLLQNAIEKG
jgi:hypothetical protein